jgi:signal transduction histidine kinase
VGLLVIWLITKGLRQVIEAVRRFKEGDRKARIENPGGSDLALLATTFNGMADTIEANIEELKSVENLRRELIANVSHDLRTPLAIMQGYVETLLMKDDLPPEERRRYLQITLDSSEKLSRLIAQLFEYSKLEAKQIQPQKEPFFIGELAQDVFQKYQILARKKGIQLTLDQPQKLPLVFADVALVERVVQNLMDNALKFTPAGGEVKIVLREAEKHVEVRIADTGPGIPESEQSAIFERYRKASASSTNQTGGAGLGLAIAKKILELHDASIRVQSRLNEGTAFMFRLPAYGG